MTNTPLLTLSEACEYLKISRETMLKLLKEAKIGGSKIGGQWRFTPESIENYIISRTIKTKKLIA